MKIKYAAAVLMLFFLINIPVSSQVTQEWVRNYYTNHTDFASKVVTDKFTGDIYICGVSSFTLFVHKYRPDGRPVWFETYSTASSIYISDMILDNLGGVIILGAEYNTEIQNYDILTLKYSTDGNLLWYRKYNGPDKKNDIPVALATDGQGGIVVTGNVRKIDSFYDVFVMKYDINGFTEWIQFYRYSVNRDNKVSSVAVDGTGNIYLSVNAGSLDAEKRWITLKYSSVGDMEWSRSELSDTGVIGMQVINAEELGRVFSIGIDLTGRNKLKVNCYDRLGNLRWYNEYDKWTTFSKAVFDDRYNKMYLFGSLNEDSVSKLRILAFNAEEGGETIWSDEYAGLSNTSCFSSDITLGNDYNIYITGWQQRSPNVSDFFTMNYDFDGNRLWEKLYNYYGNSGDRPRSISIDYLGNIYVLGNSLHLVNGYTVTLIKYSQDIFPRFSSEIPESFKLHQNYPNPFNPSTQVKYDLPLDANVKITVFDMLGKEIAVLVNEYKAAGSYDVSFNATQLSSGMYFYRIEAGSFTETKKMLLVK